MSSSTSHRGPAPRDAELFAPERLPVLRVAVHELSWLLGRGYADVSALKLVGDRHALTARQRLAVRRCACSDAERDRRGMHVLDVDDIRDRVVDVDGFNVLIGVESALSGGLVLVGRDRAHRDLASVHGTWKRVSETADAIDAIGARLAGAREVRWYLDRPVGNSGRLRALLAERAQTHAWPWSIELVPSPDPVLAASTNVVATGDAWILDRCESWIDLPGAIVADHPAWVVDLGSGGSVSSA